MNKISGLLLDRIDIQCEIADLEASNRILSHHIAEAIGYRNLDRGGWAGRGV